MALFGPKDRRLPLLTQLYQVEEDNIKEMDTMLNLRREMPLVGMTRSACEEASFIRLHKIVRRLMDRAINGEASTEDVKVFNGYWKGHAEDFVFRPTEAKDKEEEVLPISSLRIGRSSCNDPWRDWETEIVHDLAGVLLNQGKDLGCCPECKSVFVTTRRGRRYCSSRCQNRAGVRRMADRKKVLGAGFEGRAEDCAARVAVIAEQAELDVPLPVMVYEHGHNSEDREECLR